MTVTHAPGSRVLTLPAPRGGPAVRRRRRRGLTAAAAALVLASSLAACGGGGSGGTPTLSWYINPDSGGQAEIAARCSKASGGRYTIEVSQLPRDAPSQREQLVRRLAASDSSIDIMSLDPPYIPEFAQAGFLAPVPADLAQRVSQGVVDSAIQGSTWNGKLVAIPFWANTQLLWYRKSVAQAAGLDTTKPVTWDQLIQAAKSQHVTIGAQGIRSESLTSSRRTRRTPRTSSWG
jgi:multiple sugar transport system substrate-binding protein